MPITKTDADRIGPNSTIWDKGRGSVPGFGLRRQTKLPTFFVKYSVRGKQRWFTIGKLGAPWTVETARQESRRLLGVIVSGGDPADEREAPRKITIAELCDQYMAAALAGSVLTRFNRPKKASTLEIDKGRIARHIKPLIGKKSVDDVDGKVVRRLISDITVGKTATTVKTKSRGKAIVSGGPGTAARVADLLSGIMTWAVDEGIVDRNPVHRIRRYRGEPRQRFLNFDELRSLGAVLLSGNDEHKRRIHPHAISIVRLLCLTGCRVGEIAGLKWREVDLEMKCLRLQDTKSGKSLRAIGDGAVAVLKQQTKAAGSQFVFSGRARGVAYQGIGKEARRIFKAGSIAGATPHSLRHTFASVASELGYSDATIGGLLGHSGRGITSRYVHRPDQALATAAAAVCAELNRQMFAL